MDIKLDVYKKWLIYMAAFMMAIVLSGCYSEKYTKRVVKLVITTDSSAEASKLDGHRSTVLPIGGKIKLQALAAFDDSTFDDVSNDTEWRSSDPDIVEVDRQGWVTALTHSQRLAHTNNDIEEVEISATKHGVTAIYQVKVTGAIISSIELTPHRIDLNKGNTAKLTATGTYTDGSTRELNTNTDSLIWESSNYDMVSIINGVVTAENVGAVGELAQITVTREVENEPTVVSSPAEVLVLEKELTRIEVRPDPVALPIGTELPLSVMAIYTDGTEGDITSNGYIRWSDDGDHDIAEVTPRGVMRAFKLGTTTVTAELYEHKATNDVIVSNEKLESITITPSQDMTLPLGFTHQFEATGGFDDGVDRPVTDIVTWVSSDPLVVSASESGLVAANSIGIANIHAEFDNGDEIVKSEEIEIFVTEAYLTSIELTPLNLELSIGGDYAPIVAMGTYSTDEKYDISSMVTWSSSEEGIVTIDRGAVRGIREGSVDISASYVNENGDTITSNEDAKVSVSDASLVSIILTGSGDVNVGMTTQLQAIGMHANNTTSDYTDKVDWQSDDESIAVVGLNSGVVEGISEGVTNITASFGDVSSNNSIEASVSGSKLQKITITPYAGLATYSDTDTIIAGYDQLYIAKGEYSDGSAPDEPINTDVVWSITSNEEGVASVSAEGKVTTYKKGTATLTAIAKVGDVESDPFTIEVTEAELVDIEVKSDDSTILMGEHTTVTAKGIFSDGTELEPFSPVVWSTSNDNATVDQNTGDVKGITAGTITITATADTAAVLERTARGQGRLAGTASRAVKGSVDIEVLNKEVVGIEIVPFNFNGVSGNDNFVPYNAPVLQLKANYIYSDGSIEIVPSFHTNWTMTNVPYYSLTEQGRLKSIWELEYDQDGNHTDKSASLVVYSSREDIFSKPMKITTGPLKPDGKQGTDETCKHLGRTFIRGSSGIDHNKCFSVLASDVDNPNSRIVMAPLSKDLIAEYNLTSDLLYYSNGTPAGTGQFPRGDYAVNYPFVKPTHGEHPVEMLCERMRDIKLFGFDNWGVDTYKGSDGEVIYFQKGYQGLFKDGRLVGHWPTTANSGHDHYYHRRFSYHENYNASDLSTARFLDGDESSRNDLVGGYLGCHVEPWQ